MGLNESLLSKNKEVIHPHCQMRIWHKSTLATSCPLVTNSLGETVKVPTRCPLAVKHLNTLAGMPYSAHPHTAQEMSAQPIVQRQMMSQYHLSPHLKEEGGRVSVGAAVGPG